MGLPQNPPQKKVDSFFLLFQGIYYNRAVHLFVFFSFLGKGGLLCYFFFVLTKFDWILYFLSTFCFVRCSSEFNPILTTFFRNLIYFSNFWFKQTKKTRFGPLSETKSFKKWFFVFVLVHVNQMSKNRLNFWKSRVIALNWIKPRSDISQNKKSTKPMSAK